MNTYYYYYYYHYHHHHHHHIIIYRFRDIGITEKHIERCEILFHDIAIEYFYISILFIFLKYLILPYILDGFVMTHIIGIIEKIHSRESSE